MSGLTQPISRAGGCWPTRFEKGPAGRTAAELSQGGHSGFADVESALVAIQKSAGRERLQGEVVTCSQRAFQISESRLREGTIDLVTLLNTQQALFQAEDAAAQARLAHLQAIVSLYQALGGGWLPKPVETANAR